jgi:hypothetical protein
MTREYPGAFTERVERSKRRGKQDKAREANGADGAATIELPSDLPLALAKWLDRNLPQADLFLPWLSSTSRVLFSAPTGSGKTMWGIGLGMGCAVLPAPDVLPPGFLHWRSVRAARVLLVDGEMSRRLLQQRLIDEARRLSHKPDGFHILSHEDVENFPPLNTSEGQALIEKVIERIGGVDLIIFDNVMCLLAGNMKDTEQWAATVPWVKSLTRRKIGQVWLHHTNDDGKTYGDKTREWQMDTVIIGEEVKRPDTDVSFQITFQKARERTPANRAAFADAKIALVNDQWTSDAASVGIRQGRVPPLAERFFAALVNATIGSSAKRMFSRPTATIEEWRVECLKLGLIDKDQKPDHARSLFSRHRRELIAANWISCDETMAWTLKQGGR